MKKAIILSLLLAFVASGCLYSGENSPRFDLGVFAGCATLVLALAWLIAGIGLLVLILVFLIAHFPRRKP